MAEIGEVVEVAVGKRAAHLHRRKHRAEPLAIAAGIADRHQPVGFLQNSRSVHRYAASRPDTQFFAFFAASRPATRPNTLPMVMPMPAA